MYFTACSVLLVVAQGEACVSCQHQLHVLDENVHTSLCTCFSCRTCYPLAVQHYVLYTTYPLQISDAVGVRSLQLNRISYNRPPAASLFQPVESYEPPPRSSLTFACTSSRYSHSAKGHISSLTFGGLFSSSPSLKLSFSPATPGGGVGRGGGSPRVVVMAAGQNPVAVSQPKKTQVSPPAEAEFSIA